MSLHRCEVIKPPHNQHNPQSPHNQHTLPAVLRAANPHTACGPLQCFPAPQCIACRRNLFLQSRSQPPGSLNKDTTRWSKSGSFFAGSQLNGLLLGWLIYMLIFINDWGYILLVEWLVGLVDNWLFEGGNHKWESWMVIEGRGGGGGEAAKHDHFTKTCSRQLGFNSTFLFVW